MSLHLYVTAVISLSILTPWVTFLITLPSFWFWIEKRERVKSFLHEDDCVPEMPKVL